MTRAARLGPEPEQPRTEFADLADEMRLALRGCDPEWDEWVRGVVELYSFVDRMLCKYKIPQTRPKTFRRYYREALARRRKALAAWLEILEAEECAREKIPETNRAHLRIVLAVGGRGPSDWAFALWRCGAGGWRR